MNIIKKYLYKRAMSVAKQTGYMMQEIELMRYAAILPLSKKWSDSEYDKLESARLLGSSDKVRGIPTQISTIHDRKRTVCP
ncbi:hypothetical protein [Prevotella sp. 885]|uniref:hypothetical protein n=1 Tax=Prevotella sp. 885 TaxID=2022527 RepID=UPI0015951173